MSSSSTPAAHDRRADIEGLRAISVLAVVLYHAHVAGFSGGFVGVDVFFVISGFLITRILLNEALASGTVSLPRFWLRRAVRLLPNASLTLSVTLIAGYFLIPVYDHRDLVLDVLSAAFYVSNFRFASSAVDYFRVNDTHSPVMNFWSLSVEEQYYIVFPLMVIALFALVKTRRLGAARLLLATIWLGSFALSIWFVRHDHTQAFFNTASRAWELATGALLAAGYSWVIARPASLRITLGWLGLCAIIASIVGLRDGMMLPGFWVLAPTLGCAAIIAANGESARLNAVLGHAPARWLGARSYSFYLWHWPVFTLLPLMVKGVPLMTPLMIMVALGLSWLAYEWVENPLRRAYNLRHETRRPFLAMGGLVGLVTLIGVIMLALPVIGPAPANAPMLAEIERAGKDTSATVDAHCLTGYQSVKLPSCRFGQQDSARTVTVIGDSHAAMWFSAFDDGAKQAGWAMEMFSKVVCPAADITTWKRDDRTPHRSCDIWRETLMKRLETEPKKPDLVLLTSLNQLSGDTIDRTSGEILSGQAAKDEWTRGLKATLARLTKAGIKVAVLRDIPQARIDYRQCLMTQNDPTRCDRKAADALDAVSPEARAVEAFEGVKLVDWSDLFCIDSCPLLRGSTLIYRDNHHVTDSFARTQAGRFADVLKSFE